MDNVVAILKLAEIQDAILRLDPIDREALRHWLDETAEETPELLAAIDGGLRSLKKRGVTPFEDVCYKLPSWITKAAIDDFADFLPSQRSAPARTRRFCPSGYGVPSTSGRAESRSA